MRVGDVMTNQVVGVEAGASVATAARVMAERCVGSVVVSAGNALVGILTDRDVVVRGVARGLDVENTPVSVVMSAEVRTCTKDLPLWWAQQAMEANAVRRLVVVDAETGRVEGILSADDLATLPPECLVAPVPLLAVG
jgi:CBS domain-containing protein